MSEWVHKQSTRSRKMYAGTSHLYWWGHIVLHGFSNFHLMCSQRGKFSTYFFIKLLFMFHSSVGFFLRKIFSKQKLFKNFLEDFLNCQMPSPLYSSILVVVSVPVWEEMLSVFENHAINYAIKSLTLSAFCLSSLYIHGYKPFLS